MGQGEYHLPASGCCTNLVIPIRGSLPFLSKMLFCLPPLSPPTPCQGFHALTLPQISTCSLYTTHTHAHTPSQSFLSLPNTSSLCIPGMQHLAYHTAIIPSHFYLTISPLKCSTLICECMSSHQYTA